MLLNSRVPGAGVRVSARVPACDPKTRTALGGMPRRAPHARDGHPRRESWLARSGHRRQEASRFPSQPLWAVPPMRRGVSSATIARKY